MKDEIEYSVVFLVGTKLECTLSGTNDKDQLQYCYFVTKHDLITMTYDPCSVSHS